MEATFVVKTEELTPEWLEQLKSQFGAGETIMIKAMSPEQKPTGNQYEVFLKMEEIRQRMEVVPVQLPPGVDINDLIDDINDVEL
ncbi:hypothetical protein GCM10027275_55360 [Rhabdobacter roseus]|uniref:Tfp pilus assembly protein PilO n=1 Tax=Rhabdobacter roseus TaxID=1655419 RepID=A0A840TWE2_9BACT|nr:hypothetical protein [Rhabdobacter roseus]MBB5287564.1 Tfp pilus assembly protein PilO [Rhabdobacter roseus]